MDKNWIKAIKKARESGAAVLMMVDAFNKQESDIFYDYVKYASEQGVEVMLVPEVDGPNLYNKYGKQGFITPVEIK